MREKLSKEICLGRIAGPFTKIPFPSLQVSPIGLVPKKDGDYRMIHHLSYPENQSINDFIDDRYCSVSYSNIDQAADMVSRLGKGALLSKADIKSAFRLLPINPADFDLLGIKFDNGYYFDKMLPMGSSASCAIWEKFARFLHWCLSQQTDSDDILHYLDDFFFGEASTCIKPGLLLSKFQSICYNFGVPLADEKTVQPNTCITFLGVELDTMKMIMRLPAEKVAKLKQQILKVLSMNKITLKEMQSLLGLLNFACKVVSPGRAFCRRLINATMGIKKPHHKLRVSKNMKADLNVWLSFLNKYNGVTLISRREWRTNMELELFTDACGGEKGGFGIFFSGQWAYGKWPDNWVAEGLTRDMTLLELFPVVVTLTIWSDKLRNQWVHFHVDNQAVVQVINSQTCKSDRVMNLVKTYGSNIIGE